MAAWVVPAICVIGLVHVAFGVALATARWRRARAVRRSGTEVL